MPLPTLPKASSTRLIILKLDPFATADPAEAVTNLAAHQITHLDIVLATGGKEKGGLERRGPIEEVIGHFCVNSLAPLMLFQAVLPLLRGLEEERSKFVVVTSNGSDAVEREEKPFEFAAYGSSKAAANYVVRKIHFEND